MTVGLDQQIQVLVAIVLTIYVTNPWTREGDRNPEWIAALKRKHGVTNTAGWLISFMWGIAYLFTAVSWIVYVCQPWAFDHTTGMPKDTSVNTLFLTINVLIAIFVAAVKTWSWMTHAVVDATDPRSAYWLLVIHAFIVMGLAVVILIITAVSYNPHGPQFIFFVVAWCINSAIAIVGFIVTCWYAEFKDVVHEAKLARKEEKTRA